VDVTERDGEFRQALLYSVSEFVCCFEIVPSQGLLVAALTLFPLLQIKAFAKHVLDDNKLRTSYRGLMHPIKIRLNNNQAQCCCVPVNLSMRIEFEE
jgi:hypothetical protein